MEYIERLIDKQIDHMLKVAGAVYVRGPKWCGKTTTASKKAKTIYRLGTIREKEGFDLVYHTDPEIIFEREKPILFDEWQECPYLYDEVKKHVDLADGEPGGFLITGSKELDEKTKKKYIRHNGLGRIADVFMRPLSLFESGESVGSISLSSLFEEGYSVTGKNSSLPLDRLVYAICRGGFPVAVASKDEEIALEQADLVYSSLVNRVEGEEDEEKYDEKINERFLKAYSRNICTLVPETKILSDINANGSFSLSRGTYDRYKNRFERMYMIEELGPWNPAFRSRSNMTQTPKKAFVDPSIAVSALGLSSQSLLETPINLGFFFENLVLRDLRVYAASKKMKLYYYHDRNGLETDAVLVRKDGSYALIEIKLGFNSALQAESSLLKMKSLIEDYNGKVDDKSQIMKLPSSLIVIHAGKMAITTNEGVHVVPIGSLRD